MRLITDILQLAAGLYVNLSYLMFAIIKMHLGGDIPEIALQLETVLDNKAYGALIAAETSAAESRVAGILTTENISQHVRLIVVDILVELIEVGLFDMELPIDQEYIISFLIMHDFSHLGKVATRLHNPADKR